jgi:hypothetical protein
MAGEEWTTAERALRYLARADAYPHRAEGEGVLLEQVPGNARRILDLRTGDGRLLALLRIDRSLGYRTRKDKEFCRDRCRALYHYHHVRKGKGQSSS